MKLSRLVKSLVVVLLALQAALGVLLWLVSPLGPEGTGTIALVLSADLLAFAMIVHIYRATSSPSDADSHT